MRIILVCSIAPWPHIKRFMQIRTTLLWWPLRPSKRLLSGSLWSSLLCSSFTLRTVASRFVCRHVIYSWRTARYVHVHHMANTLGCHIWWKSYGTRKVEYCNVYVGVGTARYREVCHPMLQYCSIHVLLLFPSHVPTTLSLRSHNHHTICMHVSIECYLRLIN